VRPGDIIAVTYLKEGFTRVPFRIVKLSPSLNYQLVTVLAQIHDDAWYSDNPAVLGGAGRQPVSQIQGPRPLIGLVPHNDGSGTFAFFDFQVQENISSQSNGTPIDTLTIGFSQPTKPNPNSPNLPLVSLSANGGTLQGSSNLYYAVSAVDAAGNEGALSFTVPVAVPLGSNGNGISISGLSFPSSATSFNVYRGTTPQMLYRIASNQPINASYTDPGASPQPIGPPDANFDHANFYYRYEYAGPFLVTSFSSNTIGSTDMGAASLAYVGMVVRIIEGTGRGQERSISSNDQTTVTITSTWSVLPDATSTFVIAESSWRFAAVSANSPVQFELPYRTGTVIQISGRAANVHNQEGTPDLCPLTRWALGQEQPDAGVPGIPNFSVAAPGGGELILYQIGFNDLTNTGSISTGTLQLFYWNELNTPSPYALAAALDATSTTLFLIGVLALQPSNIIQLGAELMTVLSVNATANTYTVVRGVLGSSASTHNAGDLVLHLGTSFVIVPFGANFFANRASINYLHSVSVPDVRISAAEFFVTNAFGDSQVNQICYTSDPEQGLRTLSGGQFSLQVSGYLATQQNAAPPLLIEASHAVRDIRATLSQAADGYIVNVDVLQNGTGYCSLTIQPNATTSNIFDGVSLPPLLNQGMLMINVTLQLPSGYSGALSPGRDLTVTIRL
jgi:hypothetical protein